MANKADLLSDEDRDLVRGQLQSYVRAHWPKARFRSFTADSIDDIDLAIDIGEGERFVRVSFEAALEIPNLRAHLEASRFADALEDLVPSEQLVVTTIGIRYQLLIHAFR